MNRVTVMMNTFGRSEEDLAEAVQSFLQQTYEDCELLIVNTNVTELSMPRQWEGEYRKVRILNVGDQFPSYPYQAAWAMQQVETPLWCVLDDDDIILPTHVERLVELYEENRKVFTGTIRSGKCNHLVMINGSPHGTSNHTWVDFLYERLPDEKIVDILQSRIDKGVRRVSGFDTWYKARCAKHAPKSYHEMPTYIHRRWSGRAHLSNDRRGNFQKTAVSVPLEDPIIHPHWEENYSKIVEDFAFGRDIGPNKGMSMSEEESGEILRLLQKYKVNRVLEFGAGKSTRILSRRGFQVDSWETNIKYGSKLYSQMTPLERRFATLSFWDGVHFNTASLGGYGAVLLDGPQGGKKRGPAYRVASKLKKAKLILCHDAQRKYESRFIEKYLDRPGWEQIDPLQPKLRVFVRSVKNGA